MTNADRIRTMTDAELNAFMENILHCGSLIALGSSSKQCIGCNLPFCVIGRYMEWLKLESEK